MCVRPILKCMEYKNKTKHFSLYAICFIIMRILDGRIRKRVEQEFGEEQKGFRKGRGTTDGMFILRQLVEKRMEMK